MSRHLLVAFLLAAVSLQVRADATEYSYWPTYEFRFCARNPHVEGGRERCFRKRGDGEAHIRYDPTPNKKRRFLKHFPEESGILPSGSQTTLQRWRTPDLPPESPIVTWYSAGTGASTAAVIPGPSELLSALLPEVEQAGLLSEEELTSRIRQVDQVQEGSMTGTYLDPTTNWGASAYFDAALERHQLHFDHSAPDRRTYTTAYRPWIVNKYSRYWCSHGLDRVRWGQCTNEEWGELRIYFENNQDSCTLPKPCVPATGAKELHETDFVWGAWTFMRHYSSIPGSHFLQPLGRNWSHAFNSQILATTGTDTATAAIDERMHVDRYLWNSGAVHYASTNRPGRVIQYGPAGDSSRAWKLSAGDDRTDYYNANGRLTFIERRDTPSDSLSLHYCESANQLAGECTAAGELWKVVDGRGRSLRFEYSSAAFSGSQPSSKFHPAKLVAIFSDDGLLVTYDYDAQDRLSSATFADGHSRAYVYEESANLCRDELGAVVGTCAPGEFTNHLTGLIDENDIRLGTYTYDNLGRVTASTWAGGAYPERIAYPAWDTRIVAFPDGVVRTLVFTHDRFFRLKSLTDTAGTVSYLRDWSDRLSVRTDAKGYKTQWDYAEDRVTQVTEALDTPEERTIQTDWDATANRPMERRVYAAGAALAQRNSTSYNPRGQVVVTSQVDTVGSVNRSATRAYCEAADVSVPGSTCPILGLLKTIDGPRTDVADVTTFSYYPATDESGCATSGPCHRKGDLWKVTNAAGHVTETLRYDLAGRVRAVKDPNGVITELTYHPRGWLATRRVKGYVVGEDAVTQYDYDATGQIERITRPDGDWTEFEYDDAHRLTAIEDALGNRIEYVLNAAGERTAETTEDPNGVVMRSLSREYDALGRLDVSRDAYAHATDFDYDANGNQTSVEDPLNHETLQEYDPLDRLERTLQDYGGLEAETEFAYDALDRLVKVTDPKGLDTDYTYDAFGDLTQLSSPDTGITQYTYDAAGNRATQTDARGITATYSYDALNRLTAIAYPTPGLGVSFFYDEDGDEVTGCPEFSHFGRLTRMIDPSGTTTYCYDRRGNVTQKTQVIGGTAYTTAYTYTRGDRLASLTFPNGSRVVYTYDAAGRSETVARTAPSATGIVSQTDHLPFGPVSSLHFASGLAIDYDHDDNYGIAAIAGTGLDLDFELDAAGNIVTLQHPTPSEARTFSYDALARLTQVDDGNATLIEAFTYDATGNRLSKQAGPLVETYSYPATSHRLTGIGAATLAYDAAGNTTFNQGGWTFTYGDHGRLLTAAKAGVTQTNVYNGKGERTRKTVSSTVNGYPREDETLFFYDEAGHLIGEHSKSTTTVLGVPTVTLKPAVAYAWHDERPVALLAFAPLGGRNQPLKLIETDHLGTPRAVIDPARAVAIWRWELNGLAFGDSLPDEDPDGNGSTFETEVGVPFNMRFPGQYFDAATGLHYNYFRDYEPGTGRYAESDPIGLAGGISLYGYVGSNPLIWADPFGLWPSDVYGPDPSPGNPWGHPEVGNDGRAHAVISPNAPPCLADCIQVHEQSHVDEINAFVPDWRQRGVAVGSWIGTNNATREGSAMAAASELRAWRRSLGCLLRKLKDDSCNSCADEWRAEADRARKKIEIYLIGGADDFYFGEMR